MPNRDPHSLTDFQESVCSLAVDLILRGGEETDVSNLLRATIGHSLHLQFPEFDAFNGDRIARDLPEWRQRISRHWPKTTAQDDPPKTVTGMVRANLRGDLERQFGAFLGKARMHELYLMREVLQNFENNCGGPDTSNAESALAEAFMYELSSDDSYLKVPAHLVEATEDFLEKISGELDGVPCASAPGGRPQLVASLARESGPELPNAS